MARKLIHCLKADVSKFGPYSEEDVLCEGKYYPAVAFSAYSHAVEFSRLVNDEEYRIEYFYSAGPQILCPICAAHEDLPLIVLGAIGSAG